MIADSAILPLAVALLAGHTDVMREEDPLMDRLSPSRLEERETLRHESPFAPPHASDPKDSQQGVDQ